MHGPLVFQLLFAQAAAAQQRTLRHASDEKAKSKDEEAREQAVQRTKEEYEAQLARLQQQHAEALERQRIKLTGSAEEQRALREAQEREKRVEALCAKAAKRMGNQGLIKGWTGWHEMWEEQARQKRMLAAAGARLAKPALTMEQEFDRPCAWADHKGQPHSLRDGWALCILVHHYLPELLPATQPPWPSGPAVTLCKE